MKQTAIRRKAWIAFGLAWGAFMAGGAPARWALADDPAPPIAEPPTVEARPAATSQLTTLPGAQQSGEILLPTQWSLRPAGEQIKVGDFPVNIAMHPTEPYAAILHSGYGNHDLLILDLRTNEVADKHTFRQAFYGLTFTPDGKRLFASGGEYSRVHQFDFAAGKLANEKWRSLQGERRAAASEHKPPDGTPANETPLNGNGAPKDDSAKGIETEAAAKQGGTNEGPGKKSTANEERRKAAPGDMVAAGLTVSPDGQTLFTCNAWGDRLGLFSLAPEAGSEPPQHSAEPTLIEMPADSYPYACLVSHDCKRAFVSLWGKSAVAVVDLDARKIVEMWSAESHPTEMVCSPDGALLYVACANSNQTCIIDVATGKTLEVVGSSLYPKAPNGSTPSSLALSADGKTLYIANADNNNVAVIDVSTRGASRSRGFIPAGWYPTSVRISPATGKLYIANGKGLSSKPNPAGPNPLKNRPKNLTEYIGGLLRGTISVLDPPSDEQLTAMTRAAFQCSPLNRDTAPRTSLRTANNPIPAKLGDKSPIRYCVYIIKENRTYDQVLGDLPQGNGDATLCLFPEKVTPNQHALVKQFVLLDNFYVEGEVSADGHEWTMGAYATDFVEKTWPLNYRRDSRGIFRYPAEGQFDIAIPAGGYLWDRCREKDVSYHSYGEFVRNGEKEGEPAKAALKVLEGHFDPDFRSYDLDYPDVKRAQRLAEELKRWETAGDLPRLIVMRLPNDHTYGTRVGKPTPTAMVAENDLAVGHTLEALSHSKFWKEMAVFIVEDDAQNGSDHVDAHRTTAYVAGPYVKRGAVDSSMYSTASMLRTMELILGISPMSQYDAAALPMYQSFTEEPDFRPFTHTPAGVDITRKNMLLDFGSQLSSKLDFSKEDAADDLQLNEIVWRSVRGADSPMPPPVRASFFFARAANEEDDDVKERDDKERDEE